MKRIKEAARQFALMYVDGDSSHFNPLGLAFRAGARCALDAMTSEAAATAFGAYCGASALADEESAWSLALAAVRKEIEG